MSDKHDPIVAYRNAAVSRHHMGGELEVGPDAPVSVSDDGGAYVQCWVWVPDEDAGV